MNFEQKLNEFEMKIDGEKNWEHDGNNITRENKERTTEEQSSNANSFVTCLFMTKYVND